MDRSSGGILAIAILVAVLAGGSGLRTAQEPGTTKGPAKHLQKDVTDHKPTQGKLLSEELSGYREEVVNVQKTVSGATMPKLAPDYEQQLTDTLKSETPRQDFGFMIALLPDPVKTHLALKFDRDLDALEQALQDCGFDFDRQVLPWDAGEHPESDDFRVRLAEGDYNGGKEDVPGLLIFRRHHRNEPNPLGGPAHGCKDDARMVIKPAQNQNARSARAGKTVVSRDGAIYPVETLLVFVVGESPTAGIDRTQFTTTIKIAQKLCTFPGEKKSLIIVGPSFSGSLVSLSELLAGDARAFSPIVIASGGVSSNDSVNSFRDAVQEKFGSTQPVNFATFQESDDDKRTALFQYACETWDVVPADVAIISETETAYGRQDAPALDSRVCPLVDGAARTPLRLFFPRGIFHVRTAYEEQFGQGAGSDAERAQLRSNLRINLEEKRTGADSIPDFSPQSAVSQDAVLIGMVDELHRHNTKIILLFASDPLDTLFLVRHLSKNYPYGRIVTGGPDLLLRHESDDPNIRGLLTLSAYSLQAGNGARLTRSEPGIIFADDGSKGVYNATVALASCMRAPLEDWCKRNIVADSAKPPLPAGLRLVGYPHLNSGASENTPFGPPLHLDVLGRAGFVQVATPQSPVAESWLPQALTSRPGNTASESSKERPFELPGSWKGLTVLILGCMAFLILCICRASLVSAFEPEVLLSPCLAGDAYLATGVVRGLRRDALIVALCAGWYSLLGLMLWPLFSPAVKHEATFFWLAAVALLVCLGLCIAMWRRFGGWIRWIIPLYLFLCVLGSAALSRMVERPFLARYVNIDSQISPSIPLLLACLSVAWWIWYNTSASVLSDVRRPHVPKLKDLPKQLADISSEEQARLESAMIPGHLEFRIWLPAAGLAAIVVPLFGLNRLVWSIEPFIYDWVMTLLLAMSLGLLLESLLRILIVWTEAKRLLRGLNNQAFRYSISRVGGITWTSIWRVGTASLTAAHSLFIRQIEALNALRVRLTSAPQATIQDGQISRLRIADREMTMHTAPPCQPRYVRDEVVKFVEIAQLPNGEKVRDLEVDEASANQLLPAAQLEKVWNDYESILAMRRTSEARSAKIQKKETDLLRTYGNLQSTLAASAGRLLSVLGPYYQQHAVLSCDLQDEASPKGKVKVPATAKELAEHFVSMIYINYIVTILLRIRTLAAAAVGIFVLDVLAVNSYPFEPRAVLRAAMFAIFAAITACFALVYGQMHRDPILSRMTDTKSGELGGDFWFRMLTLTGLPIASLVATAFPSVGNFLFSWIEPVIKAAH